MYLSIVRVHVNLVYRLLLVHVHVLQLYIIVHVRLVAQLHVFQQASLDPAHVATSTPRRSQAAAVS